MRAARPEGRRLPARPRLTRVVIVLSLLSALPVAMAAR
jgi:hypothetical protein